MEHSRRIVLLGIGTGVGALAGCTGLSESGVEDSDGDGVVDSQDYAPNDPAVQKKSDLAGTAQPTATKGRNSAESPTESATPTSSPPASSATPTVTPSATRTRSPTPTASPTRRKDSSNAIRADRTYYATSGISHITAYSPRSVTAELSGALDVPYERGKLVYGMFGFPDGDIVAYGTSEAVHLPTGSNTISVTASHEDGSVPTGQRLYHAAGVIPASKSFENLEDGDLTYVSQSDPFVYEGGRVSRSIPSYMPGSEATESFTRTPMEGAYLLRFEGTTNGRDWWVENYIYKAAYAASRQEPRGRSYPEYVARAQNNGYADDIAEILHDHAQSIGFTDKRVQVEFVIDLIQGLPYVTDDVSRGFDDYPKTIAETLVEGDGDCEDTAILTAAVLQAEPFGYDMVLIRFEDHMGAGIFGTDLPGYFWTYEERDYYYIETTGSGWGIGDLPDEYQNESAYVYQV